MTLKNIENQTIDLELLEKIATNIKIIQNEDEFNFKDFINNNEINTVATELEGEYYNGGKYKFFIVFYKVELVKGIYQILSQRNEFSPIFNLSYAYGGDLKGDIFGYYSSYQNCFYKHRKSYYIEYIEDKVNFNDIEVIKYFDLLENINKEVNKNISDSINDDIKNLNLSNEEDENFKEYINDNFLKDCKLEAKKAFLKGDGFYYENYADYNINSERYKRYEVEFDNIKLIKALYNKENLIKEEYENFIKNQDNKQFIYKTIIRNQYVNKYIQEFKQDKDMNKLKEIHNVLNDDTKKTLHITYTKDNHTLNFQIKGNPEIRYFEKISSYEIKNKNDRTLFQDTFKGDWISEDIELKYIEKISYGKQVLYEK